jgi:hypothetical protein
LQIRIRTIDGKVYGDSEIFSIGPPKEGKWRPWRGKEKPNNLSK